MTFAEPYSKGGIGVRTIATSDLGRFVHE
jgi:hypothetical protein